MKILKRILLLLAFLGFWEFLANNNPTFRFLLSSPINSVKYAYNNISQLGEATIYTFTEAYIGFIIAILFSFILMYVCLIYPSLLKKIQPLIITSQILPMITLAPLFIILFGIGMLSKIAMVVLMCFFPVFINFSSGVNSISQNIKDLIYLYNTRKNFNIFKIIIPLSTPYIFTGLKISTTMAVMGAIVAEFIGARSGLGKNLYLAPKTSKADLMICSIFLTIILGLAIYRLIELIEKKKGSWYLNNNNKIDRS